MAAEERGLLLEHSGAEQAYLRAVTGQLGRLTPLGLIDDQGGDDSITVVFISRSPA